MQRCILASGSPRRREILAHLGLEFEVVVSDADERTEETDPARLSEELSARKGCAVRDLLAARGEDVSGKLLIASDTTVFCGNEILGKPRDAADAHRMLSMLSGRRHEVVSGIWLCRDGVEAVSHAVTAVEFAPLTEREIASYIASGEPFGKAGAYAIQGLAASFIRGIDGDYFNVVGLPVNRMCDLYRSVFGGELVLREEG